MKTGIVTLAFVGVFYCKEAPTKPLLVFADPSAPVGEDNETYYDLETMEDVAYNYGRQGNELQVEEFATARAFLEKMPKVSC